MNTDKLGLAAINRLLDEAKTTTGSDRKTALRLGYQAPFIYKWRSGERPLPVEASARLALILKRPWPQIIAEVEAAQAKTVKSKDFWVQVTAGALSVSLALLLAAPEVHADSLISTAVGSIQSPPIQAEDCLSIMRSNM